MACCICDECEDCPHNEETACVENLHQEAIDVINRQKAEIERFQKLLDDKCNRCIAKERAEAVKEVIQKLKEKAEIVSGGDYGFVYEITEDNIDNLVKEMVGAEK